MADEAPLFFERRLGGLFDAGDEQQAAAIAELDHASEAFADIIPWEGQNV